MRENFDKAFSILMEFEGGYVNDPTDKGGATKYGISQKSYPDENIASLTIERAKELYLRDYWGVAGCDDLTYPWDVVVFDTAVHVGPETAKLIARHSASWQDVLFHRARRYVQIVGKNPSQIKFLRGWMNRVIRLWEAVK